MIARNTNLQKQRTDLGHLDGFVPVSDTCIPPQAPGGFAGERWRYDVHDLLKVPFYLHDVRNGHDELFLRFPRPRCGSRACLHLLHRLQKQENRIDNDLSGILSVVLLTSSSLLSESHGPCPFSQSHHVTPRPTSLHGLSSLIHLIRPLHLPLPLPPSFALHFLHHPSSISRSLRHPAPFSVSSQVIPSLLFHSPHHSFRRCQDQHHPHVSKMRAFQKGSRPSSTSSISYSKHSNCCHRSPFPPS